MPLGVRSCPSLAVKGRAMTTINMNGDRVIIERVLPVKLQAPVFQGIGSDLSLPVYAICVQYAPEQDRFLAKRLLGLPVPCLLQVSLHSPNRFRLADSDIVFMTKEVNRAAQEAGFPFRAERYQGYLKLRVLYLDEI